MPGSGRTRSRARDTARAAAAHLTTGPAVPGVAALGAVQLGIAVWIALSSTHNHFVWYSGGDATEYWTASWSLAHGMIGQTIVGYGVPVLYAWVPLLTGTTLLSGLPVIAVLQLVVLAPLALVLFWAVADLLFGRLFAWWASLLWVLAPLLMLAGFRSDYASEFKNLFLAPHWVGLTNMADLPSLVAVLAAAWAGLRLYERRSTEDAVLCGLLAGVAIGIKPANGFFLPALAVLVLTVARIRPLVAWGVAFLPAVITLALWKERGLGNLPVTSYAPVREASGTAPLLAASPNRYIHFSPYHLHHELIDLKEVFWSVRVLDFLVFAGAIAVLRRVPVKGAFVILWFTAFCIVKGSSAHADITTLSYFRFVEPGLPAFILLAASIVFLVPRRGRPFAASPVRRALPGGRRTGAAAAILLGLVPLVLVLAASPAATARYVRSDELANDAPLSAALAPTVSTAGNTVQLHWTPAGSHGAVANYVVFRSSTGDGCTAPAEGARICSLDMKQIGTTRSTTFVDRPGAGRHWYRIGLAANYQGVLSSGDLMLLSSATSAASAR